MELDRLKGTLTKMNPKNVGRKQIRHNKRKEEE
jgi:hypothetical protein